MVELGLGAVAGSVLGSVGHILFDVLDRLGELAGVKLDEIDGGLGEHGQTRGADRRRQAA